MKTAQAFLIFGLFSGSALAEYTWNGDKWLWVSEDTATTPEPYVSEGSGSWDQYSDRVDDDSYNYDDDDYYFDYNSNNNGNNRANGNTGFSSSVKFSFPPANGGHSPIDNKETNSYLNTDDEDLIRGGSIEGSGGFNPSLWSEPDVGTAEEGSGAGPAVMTPSIPDDRQTFNSFVPSTDIDIDTAGSFGRVNVNQEATSEATDSYDTYGQYDRDMDDYADYYDNYDDHDVGEDVTDLDEIADPDDDDLHKDHDDISIDDFSDEHPAPNSNVHDETTSSALPAPTSTQSTTVIYRQPDETTDRPAVAFPGPAGPEDDDIAKRPTNRPVSFFAQPGILAAVIGGAVVGLLCAILLVMFIVYRMRKKDEGSYILDEPNKQRTLNGNVYSKTPNREFYA